MIKDNIKTIRALIILFAIIIVIIYLFGIEKNSDKLKKVDTPNVYFSAINYSNYFINNISLHNDDIIYDILYSKYKNDNIETNSEFFEIKYNLSEKVTIKNTSVDYIELDNNYIFYVEGKIYQDDINSKKLVDSNYAIIIIIDNNNKTFSIYPTSKDNYKKDLNKIKKINIEENDNNQLLASELISKEKMCILYMNDFMDKMHNSPDNGYSLLNKQMKRKYNTVESYQKKVNSNINNLTTVASKCAVVNANTKNNNNKKYTVIDEKGNKFIFKENAIMDYEVELYLNEKNKY